MWDMANNRDCIKIRKMSETEKEGEGRIKTLILLESHVLKTY